jgi:hypothetical protein
MHNLNEIILQMNLAIQPERVILWEMIRTVLPRIGRKTLMLQTMHTHLFT